MSCWIGEILMRRRTRVSTTARQPRRGLGISIVIILLLMAACESSQPTQTGRQPDTQALSSSESTATVNPTTEPSPTAEPTEASTPTPVPLTATVSQDSNVRDQPTT